MTRQTSVMKCEGHEPPPSAGCSSYPVGQANLMAKLYAKFWIQNYQIVSLTVILQDWMTQLIFY